MQRQEVLILDINLDIKKIKSNITVFMNKKYYYSLLLLDHCYASVPFNIETPHEYKCSSSLPQ